ncbi:MAG: glycosyltransferase, partial [Desulfamplus sp.]|nr:glycosyltransferase [Desulfamplus sp.]
WLTRLQTLMLSPHFGIEHKIRFSRHLFFNFNGTAGVWRKEAIELSGGWQDDTVTEDLDLSYRVQLSGWKFLYLNDVVVPSELPINLSDFRSQQERWSKGSIQTARKILPSLLSSPVSLSVKIEAIAHLMANICWLLGFIVTITLYPVIFYRLSIGICQITWIDIPLLCISSAILTYYLVYSIFSDQSYVLTVLPLLPIISIALSPFFAFSVVKGLFEKGGVFVRTPKFGFSDNSDRNYTCELQ